MRIAIVFGGKSVEHDVSIVTAKQIYSMVDTSKYDVELIYVTRDNKFYLYKNKKFEFNDFKNERPQSQFSDVYFSCGNMYVKQFLATKCLKIDCAILCCHGGSGENGTISSYFIANEIPVSAGNGTALGVSMNKWLTKCYLKSNRIDCVKGFCVNKKTSIEEIHKLIIKKTGYPVIIKPNSGGSSIGIQIANTPEELKSALDVTFQFDTDVLIEEEIKDFTEYNCAVIGNSQYYKSSRIDEAIKQDEILSFADKYIRGGKKKNCKGMGSCQRKFPAQLDAKLEQQIKCISEKIFNGLSFFGVIRIDFIFQQKTKRLYVNEINAIPGSLANYFFVDDKYSNQQFIDELVNIAISEYIFCDKINTKFITNLF